MDMHASWRCCNQTLPYGFGAHFYQQIVRLDWLMTSELQWEFGERSLVEEQPPKPERKLQTAEFSSSKKTRKKQVQITFP